MGESLQQMYLDDCKELRLAKPNTELVKKLPSHSSDSGTLTELDMSANVIGVKGVMALLRVIAAAPNLSHLNFKDNNLTNQCIRDLVAVLQVHPGIRVLDLSNNPLTTAAGKDLLSLAKKNTRIEDIITTDTIIRPLMTNCISHQLDRNCNRGSTGAVAFRFGDDTAQAFEVEDEAAEARRLVFGHGPDEDQSDEEQRKVHKRWSGSAGTRRKTVSSAAFNAQESREFVLAVVPKSDDEIDWLTNSLMNNALFAHLDDREIVGAVGAMFKETYHKGDVVYTYGDYDEHGTDRFYVIIAGQCQLENSVGDPVKVVGPKETFGETEVMCCQSRDHSVVVVSDGAEMWALERETYRHLMTATFMRKRQAHYEFLGGVSFSRCLTHEERIQLSDALEPFTADSGEYLIRYGEEGQWFYIVTEGTVEVLGRDSDGNVIMVCEFGVGDCVGELEFIHGHKTVADVKAKGPIRAVRLIRAHFELCMGPVLDILKRNSDTSNPTYDYYNTLMSGASEIHAKDSHNPYAGFAFGEEQDSEDDQPIRSHIKFGISDESDSEDDVATDAEEECDEEYHNDLQAKFKMQLGAVRRRTVCSEVIPEEDCETYRSSIIPKTPEEMKQLSEALQDNALFAHLEDREFDVILQAMHKLTYTKGQNVMTQGELEDSHFYVVQRGHCCLIIDGVEKTRIGPRDSFGELELLHSQPRHATVRVESDTAECWALDRSTYRHIMTGTFMRKRKVYEEFLKNVSFMKALSHLELLQLADALQPARYAEGSYLIKYNDDGRWMHIVVDGTVEVIGRDDDLNPIKVCEFGAGKTVGELEFIYHHRTVADVRAVTEVRTARLNRTHFEMCLGPIVDILKRNASEENKVYDYYNHTRKGSSIKAMPPGEGGSGFTFGAVPDSEDPSLVVEEASDDDVDEEARREAAARADYFRTQNPNERRRTVSSEVFDATGDAHTYTHTVVPKTPEAAADLTTVLSENYLFKHLDDREIRVAVEAMFPVDYANGDIVMKQGQDSSEQDTFHVIIEGRCSVVADGVVKRVAGAGDTIGELELMYNQRRTHTILASTALRTWALDRNSYRHIMTGTFIKKRQLYEDFLRNISLLKPLSHVELLQLADALQPCTGEEGSFLIEYGEEGMWCYIIVEGIVEVIGRDSNGRKIKICEFKRGDCVGEMEFIHHHKTVADVVCKTHVRAAKLNRPHFELCMGPVKDLLSRSRETDPVFDYYNQTRKHSTIVALKPDDPYGGFAFGGDAPKGEGGSYRVTVAGADVDTDSCPSTPGLDEDRVSAQTAEFAKLPLRRKTVSGDTVDAHAEELTFEPKVHPKPVEDIQKLTTVLATNALFSHLEDHELEMAVNAMFPIQFIRAETIATQGEQWSEEDNFYVIMQGECTTQRDDEPLRTLKEGDYFGELELLYSQPRVATIVCVSDVMATYALDRPTYKRTMNSTFIKKRRMYEDFLKKVPFLKCMTHLELLQLADALEPAPLKVGEYLIRYDEEGEWMYLILEGTVEVIGRKEDTQVRMSEVRVCEFGAGDVVGELEFIYNHRTVADVRALTAVRAAKLNRPHFEMCMGPVVEVLKRNASETNHVYDYYNETRKASMLNLKPDSQ